MLAAAGSVNAVEILKSDAGTVDFYGQLRQEFKKLDGKDATLSSGSSRAGFDAKYAINEELNWLGKAELSLNESKASDKKLVITLVKMSTCVSILSVSLVILVL